MSTFYVLPSRHQLGRQFAQVLGTLFPGLTWPSATWPDLAEVLGGTAREQMGVYVVYRDDLPEGAAPADALAGSCGAEPGDDVVEVLPGAALGEVSVRRWRLPLPGQAAA